MLSASVRANCEERNVMRCVRPTYSLTVTITRQNQEADAQRSKRMGQAEADPTQANSLNAWCS
jgi:hypothetical protein